MPQELTFDPGRLTVREIDVLFKAETDMDFDGMAAGMAKVCVKIEGYTGEITAQTFASLKYVQWKQVMALYLEAVRDQKISEIEIAGLAYDLKNLSARDMVALQRSMRRIDTKTIIDVLTRNVTACPVAWGKPNKAATWQARSFFGEVMPVVNAIVRDANDGEKNESGTSIFGFQV